MARVSLTPCPGLQGKASTDYQNVPVVNILEDGVLGDELKMHRQLGHFLVAVLVESTVCHLTQLARVSGFQEAFAVALPPLQFLNCVDHPFEPLGGSTQTCMGG